MPQRWYADYERGRPGYPAAVADLPGIPGSATVLDLAAGTGKLTRLLVPRFARVLAVEPDEQMRHLLRDVVPGATALAGVAEEIPLDDGSVDAVFVAQSFHWFDTEETLREIARVLRGGGRLVVTWNVATGPGLAGIAPVEELLAPHWPAELGFPFDMTSEGWEPEAWASPCARSTFGEVRRTRLPNPHTVDADGVVAFFGSMGWIAILPDDVRVPLLSAMKGRLAGSRYVLPWETCVHWTRRLPAS